METIRKIRLAHHRDQKPIRQIARDMNLSRNTVRKIIRSDVTEQHYERQTQPSPKLKPYQEQLTQALDEWENLAPMFTFGFRPIGDLVEALDPDKHLTRAENVFGVSAPDDKQINERRVGYGVWIPASARMTIFDFDSQGSSDPIKLSPFSATLFI